MFGQLSAARVLCPAVLLALLALNGCGGDGGGGDEDVFRGTPETSDATTRLSSQAVSEDDIRSVLLESGVKEDAVRAVSTKDAASASIEDGRVVIDSDTVDRPESTVVLIGDGNGNAIAKIHVAVSNDSAQPLVDEIETWLAEEDGLRALDEDAALYDLLVQSAYLSRTIDAAKESDLKTNWKPTEQASHEELALALVVLDNSLSSYNNGDIGDSELASALDAVKAALETHQAYATDRLTTLKTDTGASLSLVEESPAYNTATQTVSRYVGNEMVGENTDNGWIFDSGYRHLELAVEISELAVCQQDL